MIFNSSVRFCVFITCFNFILGDQTGWEISGIFFGDSWGYTDHIGKRIAWLQINSHQYQYGFQNTLFFLLDAFSTEL